MCTIVAFHERGRLVVAANRDELYARAFTPPAWEGEILAGRDVLGGGTWMGATRAGFFAGLTNQRLMAPPDPSKRSRGEVVMAALRAGSVEEVDALLRGLAGADYNAFNLIYGDGQALHAAYVRDEVEIEALDPGIWVLANDRIGSPLFPKAERARDLAERGVTLETLLADHELPAIIPPPPDWIPAAMAPKLQSICVHTPAYGTSSATICVIENGLREYRFAAGPPCTTPFARV